MPLFVNQFNCVWSRNGVIYAETLLTSDYEIRRIVSCYLNQGMPIKVIGQWL